MNALIKKEIRLILPAWIAAMLLAIAPIWFIRDGNAGYFFLLGTIFLGIASFGQELAFRTFPMMLSQPVTRNRIWLVKIFVLAVAFITVLICGIFSWIFSRTAFASDSIFANFIPILLGALVFYSGGLWTTLLLRQTTGAFWFTLLMPAAIVTSIAGLGEHYQWSDKVTGIIAAVTFAIYSVAGFFYARRLFLNAQDTQWTGGEISFSWLKKTPDRTVASISTQPRHWLSALVRKEFQLHQGNILIAVLVLALHLASVVIRKIHPSFENPNVKFILETIWALWLLMPLLVGSAAVAEERRLGIMESQLCLPVTRRTQLLVKFFVALVLSLIFGAIMPLLIESPRDVGNSVLVLPIFIAASVIFFISFYASTLARTTLQAIGVTIGIFAVIYFYLVVTAVNILNFRIYSTNASVALELLKLYLGIPVLISIFSWLAFSNSKHVNENWKLWRRNCFIVSGAFAAIFILTNAIYFRAWEMLMPVEPRGPARLSDSTQVELTTHGNTIYATLPDGRLWMESLAFDVGSNRWRGNFETLVPDGCKSQFIDGSNWVEVAVDNFQMLGIRSDGSLWNGQRQWNKQQSIWRQTNSFKLKQIGDETNWSQVASSSMGFLLLKKDGSLWNWGTNGYNWHDYSNSVPKKLAQDLITPPTRVGDETNWMKLFSSRDVYAKKNDGNFWNWGSNWAGTNRVFSMVQNTNLNDEWLNFVPRGGETLVGVKTNGELWFFEEIQLSSHKMEVRKIQLGQNAKWKTAEGAGWDTIVAIRDDGTLWKWDQAWNLINHLVKPVQIGKHSDWIEFPGNGETYYDGAFTLAADGSVWFCDEPGKYIWLAPSRRPVFVGNIFQGAVSNSQ